MEWLLIISGIHIILLFLKEYDKNYRKDWWMMSDEIIKYGIADKIITDLADIY